MGCPGASCLPVVKHRVRPLYHFTEDWYRLCVLGAGPGAASDLQLDLAEMGFLSQAKCSS